MYFRLKASVFTVKLVVSLTLNGLPLPTRYLTTSADTAKRRGYLLGLPLGVLACVVVWFFVHERGSTLTLVRIAVPLLALWLAGLTLALGSGQVPVTNRREATPRQPGRLFSVAVGFFRAAIRWRR